MAQQKRRGIATGKTQRSWYPTIELAKRLRLVAAIADEKDSDIVVRAVERELERMERDMAKTTTLRTMLRRLDVDGYEIINDGASDQNIVDYLNTMEGDGPEVAAVESDGYARIYAIDETGYQESTPILTARLPYAQYEIEYHIPGGNVFAGEGDDGGTYDVESSVPKLADMTADALRAAFPGATVNVTYELNVSGGDGRNLFVTDTTDDMRYEPGHGSDGERLADEALDVTNRVWESWDWVVYEES